MFSLVGEPLLQSFVIQVLPDSVSLNFVSIYIFFFINVSLAPRPNLHKEGNWFSTPIGTLSPLKVSGSCRFVLRERHAHLGQGMTRPNLSSQKRPFAGSPDIRYIYKVRVSFI